MSLTVCLLTLTLSAGLHALPGAPGSVLGPIDRTPIDQAPVEQPSMERGAAIVHPYGQGQPVVTCSPLRACDIELQAGETVTAVALGDSERWITSPLQSGDPERPTPHVIVKPKEHGLVTNLVIGTDRRTYHLGLISPPEGEKASSTFHRHVAFYYPADLVEPWASPEDLERLRRDSAARSSPAACPDLGLALGELSFGYGLRYRKRVPWRPTAVFDDGRHVYIQLPESVRSGDLPALLVEQGGGVMGVTNHRLKDRWYIVDGLFTRAELVVGVGKTRRKVEIYREREGE